VKSIANDAVVQPKLLVLSLPNRRKIYDIPAVTIKVAIKYIKERLSSNLGN
jgi:hypothetical protein